MPPAIPSSSGVSARTLGSAPARCLMRDRAGGEALLAKLLPGSPSALPGQPVVCLRGAISASGRCSALHLGCACQVEPDLAGEAPCGRRGVASQAEVTSIVDERDATLPSPDADADAMAFGVAFQYREQPFEQQIGASVCFRGLAITSAQSRTGGRSTSRPATMSDESTA
jgi:hypothetical protein